MYAQNTVWSCIYDTGVAEYATGMAVDQRGNIFVTGVTSTNSFLIKYNQFGEIALVKEYLVGYVDIAIDHDGNILLISTVVNDSLGKDICVTKCDSTGNILWSKSFSNNEVGVYEYGYGVDVDSNNNIVIVGKTNTESGFGAFITLKCDSEGNLLWMRIHDNKWEDYPQDITVDKHNDIVVIGYTDNGINWDWFTIKYMANGDTLWTRSYDIAQTDWAYGVTTDNAANVIVVGETHDFYPGSGGKTAMVVKYTSSGDTLWSKITKDTLQYSELSVFNDVVTDSWGNVYLAGEYGTWDTLGHLWIDFCITKLSPSGDSLWTTLVDFGPRDFVLNIALDQQKNIIVCGTEEPWPGGPYEDYNVVTAKLSNSTTNLIDPKCNTSQATMFSLAQNYPNPFNPSTTIEYELPEHSTVTLNIYDIQGRNIQTLVSESKPAGHYEVQWNGTDEPGKQVAAGIYFARLQAGQYSSVVKMVYLR